MLVTSRLGFMSLVAGCRRFTLSCAPCVPRARGVVLPPTAETRADHSPAHRTQYRLVEGAWLLDVSQGDHEPSPCRHRTRHQQGDAENEAGAHRVSRAATPAKRQAMKRRLEP